MTDRLNRRIELQKQLEKLFTEVMPGDKAYLVASYIHDLCRATCADYISRPGPAVDELEKRHENETDLGKYNQPRILKPTPPGSSEPDYVPGGVPIPRLGSMWLRHDSAAPNGLYGPSLNHYYAATNEILRRLAMQKPEPPELADGAPLGLKFGLRFDQALARALEQPTLVEALSWIAVWDTERAVKQALRNEKSGERNPDGSQWETTFTLCFDAVLKGWWPR